MALHLPDNEAGLGIAEALRIVERHFSASGIAQADAEARLLVLAATGLERSRLIAEPDRKVSQQEQQTIRDWVTRRDSGEPITRIIGRREFWTLDLRVAPDVLDPRADTEAVIETALELLGKRVGDALRILDLGTGTGALLLALVSECPKASGTGVDLSPIACALARENAARNGLAERVTIQEGNWTEGLDGRFDVILSNPPYIETSTIAGLDREVRDHDPMLALDGGADGLDAYRQIVAALPATLAPQGICVLELGIGQAAEVTKLAEQQGLVRLALRRDLGGIDRALALGWPQA